MDVAELARLELARLLDRRVLWSTGAWSAETTPTGAVLMIGRTFRLKHVVHGVDISILQRGMRCDEA